MPVGGELEPELDGLEPDRVDPALLAEDDPPLGTDELGGVRLDRGRVVELAGDGAALAGVEVLAGDGGPRAPARSRSARARVRRARGPCRARAGSGSRTAPRARARPRSGSRCRRAPPSRSPSPAPMSRRPGRRRRRPRWRARSRRGRASAPARRASRPPGRRGTRRPRAWRSRSCRRRRPPARRPRPPPRRRGGRRPRSAREPSTPKKAIVIPSPVANETALRIRPSMSSCETPSAASFASEIGLSITAALTPRPTSCSTSACTARAKPQISALQPGVRDQPDRLLVLGGDACEPRLDPVDPRLVERMRDRELVLGREDDPDRLLAVAQRRVVEPDRLVRLRLEREPVQLPGPDLLAVDHPAARTIPSGKRQSRSGPSSVMRKLSSTRSPPPSGQ